MSDVPLLTSLEPEVARLLARHNEASARIDWSYREFLPLEALHAPSDAPPLSDVAYLAVETALLTEANLPWYTAVLHEGLRDSLAPLQEFVRVWTSSEDAFGPEQYHHDVVDVACSVWDSERLGVALPEKRVALARLNKYRTVLGRVANRLSA